MRGGIRGIGFAVGSCLGLGAASAIQFILSRVAFPYNYTLIFVIGLLFLYVDASLFLFMRTQPDTEPDRSAGVIKYLAEMPSSIKENAPFRAMVMTCMFLVVANSLLSYYTLYAIRVFSASESHIAILAGLAVAASAIGYITFGAVADRKGPKTTSLIAACFVMSAGLTALAAKSLYFLYAAWIFANLANSCYAMTASLMLGEVCPPAKLPLFVGVHTAVSLALSSAILLTLAPVLENAGFAALFVTVFICGSASFLLNIFVLRKRLPDIPDNV